MRNDSLHGVHVRELKRIVDHRGALLGMLRSSDPWFEQFGEIYFSRTEPGVVKAWRKHRRTTSNLAVPFGTVKLVLCDDRDDSPTKNQIVTMEIGEPAYVLVTVPPGIWTGWQCVGSAAALLANCASAPHDDTEVEREEWNSPRIPFQWPV